MMRKIRDMRTAVVVIMVITAALLMGGCAGDNNDKVNTEPAEIEAGIENGQSEEPSDETRHEVIYHETQDIGEEAVISIVLAKVPGATRNDIYEFEKEYDDGILEYEGSIYYDGYEYEFER